MGTRDNPWFNKSMSRRAKFRDGEALLPPPLVFFEPSVDVVAAARFVLPAACLFSAPRALGSD